VPSTVPTAPDKLGQPGVTLGNDEAGRSLFAFAKGLGFLLPFLSALPVFFGTPNYLALTPLSPRQTQSSSFRRLRT